MGKYDYDLTVIGGGAAGFAGARLGARLGKKTAMIDKAKLGGETIWSGGIPSKALLQSAKIVNTMCELEKYGLSLAGKPSLNTSMVMDSCRGIIKKAYNNHLPGTFEDFGIAVFENSSASFADEHTLDFNGTRITSDKFLVTTGSSPLIPHIQGLEKIKYYTNDTIFQIKTLPYSMIITGAGPVGVELACAFNSLGVDVTLIEISETILLKEDRELTEIMNDRLCYEGVNIITGANLIKIENKKNITATYERYGKLNTVSADTLLIAAGRKPNVQGIGLELAGVTYEKSGIYTDRYLRTSAKNIFAAGDVAGPYRFSHMAGYQASIAASNAFIPIKRKINYDNVPWCIFTNPELARSGLTEEEAREKYGIIKIFKIGYSEIDRANSARAETGLAKIICDRHYRILGIHIVGERAGEIMHEAHFAKTMGIPLYKIGRTLHAYPAYSDIIRKLSKEAIIDRSGNRLFKNIYRGFV